MDFSHMCLASGIIDIVRTIEAPSIVKMHTETNLAGRAEQIAALIPPVMLPVEKIGVPVHRDVCVSAPRALDNLVAEVRVREETVVICIPRPAVNIGHILSVEEILDVDICRHIEQVRERER